jgi:hypothetical protein
MRVLPLLNPKTKENKSPHIVILGAGASRASFPEGDKYGRKLPLMNDFIETVSIEKLLRDQNINTHGINFEDFYDDLVSNNKDAELQKSIENEVYNYFCEMVIPDVATIYDYLILSLREKDIIVSFNWDPMLVQAYRRNIRLNHLPRICFLHGNVGVGACVEDECCGYLGHRCPKCSQPFQKVKLLYPIKNKDYTSDVFIRNEWNALRNFLRNAYFVTIFGYGAPRTDVAARDIMSEVWRKNRTRELAEIEIINVEPKEKLLQTWDGFIVGHHYSTTNSFKESYLWRYPRRSCDALAGATLQNDPWYENPFPEVDDLPELHSWIEILIKEEVELEEKGIPFEIKRQR